MCLLRYRMEVNFQIIKGIEWIKFAKERGGEGRVVIWWTGVMI